MNETVFINKARKMFGNVYTPFAVSMHIIFWPGDSLACGPFSENLALKLHKISSNCANSSQCSESCLSPPSAVVQTAPSSTRVFCLRPPNGRCHLHRAADWRRHKCIPHCGLGSCRVLSAWTWIDFDLFPWFKVGTVWYKVHLNRWLVDSPLFDTLIGYYTVV